MPQKIAHPTIDELCQLIPSLTKAAVWQAVKPNRDDSRYVQWPSVKDGHLRRIKYCKIPAASQQKHSMPDASIFEDMLVKLRAKREAEQRSSKAKPQKDAEALYFTLKGIVADKFPALSNIISQQYKQLPREKVRDSAEKWAAWQAIDEIYDGRLECFTAAFNMLFPSYFDSKHSFSNTLRKYREQGESICIDKRSVTKAQKRTPLFVTNFLKAQYIMAEKPNPAKAHARLIDACAKMGEKPCSLSSVKLLFNDFTNNVELYRARYGDAAAQMRLPYNSLLPAEHRNSQWQCDGWTLPFWGLTPKNFQRYTLWRAVDNHSRKIVGWALGTSENTVVIMAGLDDAIRNTGCFAAELVLDNHSFNKTEVASRLKASLEAMGVVVTVTMNAQRNQLVERTNQNLHSICAELEGCIGKSPTVKSDDARPKPEVMAELMKSKNMKTDAEMWAIAAHIVAEYNRQPQRALGNLSPNDKYEQSTSAKAFSLNEAERVRLLNPWVERKVQRGHIIIKLGSAKHEFLLSSDLYNRYNDRTLVVAYEDLAQGIYLYDPKTMEAVGTVGPKVKVAGAVVDQTAEHKRRLNQQTGRVNGSNTKARKKIEAELTEGLKANPDAIDYINAVSLPKSIRQIAQQDAEVRRSIRDREVNEDMLPIRPEASVALEAAAKTKESPFQKPGQLKMMDMKTLYGFTD